MRSAGRSAARAAWLLLLTAALPGHAADTALGFGVFSTRQAKAPVAALDPAVASLLEDGTVDRILSRHC